MTFILNIFIIYMVFIYLRLLLLLPLLLLLIFCFNHSLVIVVHFDIIVIMRTLTVKHYCESLFSWKWIFLIGNWFDRISNRQSLNNICRKVINVQMPSSCYTLSMLLIPLHCWYSFLWKSLVLLSFRETINLIKFCILLFFVKTESRTPCFFSCLLLLKLLLYTTCTAFETKVHNHVGWRLMYFRIFRNTNTKFSSVLFYSITGGFIIGCYWLWQHWQLNQRLPLSFSHSRRYVQTGEQVGRQAPVTWNYMGQKIERDKKGSCSSLIEVKRKLSCFVLILLCSVNAPPWNCWKTFLPNSSGRNDFVNKTAHLKGLRPCNNI